MKWSADNGYLEFTWVNHCGRDYVNSIELSKTHGSDRGNFKATFDTINIFHCHLGHLTSYYFDREIAVREIEAWADLIDRTTPDRILETELVVTELLGNHNLFQTALHTIKIKLLSGNELVLFAYEAISKNLNLCHVDQGDLFPRFFCNKENALKEARAWEFRMRNYLSPRPL